MPQVHFAPNPRVRKDSVHVLIQACEDERRKQSREEAKEAEKRRLSVIAEVTSLDRRESTVSEHVASILPTKSILRKTSVQLFIDKIEIISQGVTLLETKMANLEKIYQSAPTNDDEAYVIYVLSKKKEHDLVIRELDGLCSVIRHQIHSIKNDVQNAGKMGILSMDPVIRRQQYTTFVESLSRVMSSYLGSEMKFLRWEKTFEVTQSSRRASVISTFGKNSNHAGNLDDVESELTDVKNIGENLRELMVIFEDFACLVESQADLLDRMDELDQGTAEEPVAPVLTSDELEDKLLLEERMQRQMDIRSLILFGLVGFFIFAVLTVFLVSRGKVCYGGTDETSVYSCFWTDNRTTPVVH